MRPGGPPHAALDDQSLQYDAATWQPDGSASRNHQVSDRRLASSSSDPAPKAAVIQLKAPGPAQA